MAFLENAKKWFGGRKFRVVKRRVRQRRKPTNFGFLKHARDSWMPATGGIQHNSLVNRLSHTGDMRPPIRPTSQGFVLPSVVATGTIKPTSPGFNFRPKRRRLRKGKP